MLLAATFGATTKTFHPSAANAYYLVVPHNGVHEGSYGRRSDGSERPVAVSACVAPQQIDLVCQ